VSTKLLELTLEEVSLVDSPANKAATVALFKRDNGMDEETIKKLADQEVEITTLKASKEALETQVAELTKKLEDKDSVEKADEMIDFGGEKVAKSLIPAPVLKRLEEVAKAEELADLRKRADEVIPNFKGTADERGKLLKAVGEDDALLEILRACDALFKGMTEEVGKADADGSLATPVEKLNKLAADHAKEKNTTFEKGYAAVVATPEGRALLKETKQKG
jgi:hypothetical protein